MKFLKFLIVGWLLGSSSFLCADNNFLQKEIQNLATAVSETAASYKQSEASAEMMISEDREQAAIADIERIISGIETLDELNQGRDTANSFLKGNPSEKHAALQVLNRLRKKALFLGRNLAPGESRPQAPAFLEMIETPAVDTTVFLRPEDFITLKVPATEATIFLHTKKWEDRKEHFEGLLKRHECDVMASYYAKDKKPQQNSDEDELSSYNYFISCKQFVTEKLVEHYEGIKGNTFAVSLELKTGSWLFGKELDVEIEPEGERASLDWIKTVIAANPFSFIYENGNADLLQIGERKEIAGENVLFLKNARAKIWIYPSGYSRPYAIHFAEVSLGDLIFRGEK